MERHNFMEFERFVKKMHGKALETLKSFKYSPTQLFRFYFILLDIFLN